MPNQFFQGLNGGNFAPDSVDREYLQSKEMMEMCPGTGKAFLGRWLRELLSELNKRNKTFKKKKDLKVGHVVLILSTKSKQGNRTSARGVSRKRKSCTSCESLNWGSRIHLTDI